MKIDEPFYEYKGMIWQPCKTLASGDSFFHAAFGTISIETTDMYFDIDAAFRRRCWSNFLEYFKDDIPSEVKKLLQANNVKDISNYIKDVMLRQHCVTMDEIPFISTVENVKIVIFVDNDTSPTIILPLRGLQHDYPLQNNNILKEIVLSLDGNVYTRLSSSGLSGRTKNSTHYKKLQGSAGIKGSLYQVNLLTIFLLNGLRKHTNWRLSTENKDAGKFDDLVIEFLPLGETIFLQAKYRKKKYKKITLDELFSLNTDKDDFSLPKYFSSYQKIKTKFKVKSLIICTNVNDLHETVKGFAKCEIIRCDHMLYFNGAGGKCYQFNTGILEKLRRGIRDYYEQNLKHEILKNDIISDENLKDFLYHLYFIVKYPSRDDLDQIVEDMISATDFCANVDSRDLFKIINKKMIDWFEDGKGNYLTRTDAKALFCEVLSNKFCEKLHNCNIFFKNDDLYQYLNGSKRIIHIIPQKDPIFYMIKVYRVIRDIEEKKNRRKGRNYLFMNPSGGINSQSDIVEVFELPHYVYLVICLNTNENIIENMAQNILRILNIYDYKKVILIAENKDKLVKRIRKGNVHLYQCVTEDILTSHLTNDSLKSLMEKVTIFF